MIAPSSAPPTRKIICVDMDEVIADALGEHLLRYNRDFPSPPSTELTRAALHGVSLWNAVPPERQHVLERYMRSDDFFADLPVMPEAQRVLERLQSRFDVFIATAAMEVPTSFNAKYNWLSKHFPFISPSRVVFCGDKSILHADFLIDDNPRQLHRFRGEGILYTSPGNAFVTGFRRVNDWLDVETMFLG